MKVFTTYESCDYSIRECDAILLFSETGTSLTFYQICLLSEARRCEVPVVLATPSPMCIRHSTAGDEHYVLYGAQSMADARLVFDAAVEDYGLLALECQHVAHCSKLADLLRSSGSPIETKLTLAVCLRIMSDSAQIFAQHQIASYRADLAIVYDNRHKIVVEADGHDFHERTKEQAQRDKQRDREMQTLGWRVMRFTGSEIWKDPTGCAGQVCDLLVALMRGAA